MTPKQIRKLITKHDGHYAYYDNDIEAWVVFHQSWSLTKCRRFLNGLFKEMAEY